MNGHYNARGDALVRGWVGYDRPELRCFMRGALLASCLLGISLPRKVNRAIVRAPLLNESLAADLLRAGG